MPGAEFLTSDGFDPEIVNFAVKENIVVIPGTLTPSEVMRAWKLGPDFVKVVPCAQVGGDSYIRALKAMFPNVPLIAAGGVNQQTASSFILAGAMALGIGAELIPREAIRMRQPDRIAELGAAVLQLCQQRPEASAGQVQARPEAERFGISLRESQRSEATPAV